MAFGNFIEFWGVVEKKSSIINTCGRSFLEEIMSMWMNGTFELGKFLHQKKNKTESFVEPFTTWFKPITDEFNGKVVFGKYARGWVVLSSIGSSKQGVVCKWKKNVEDSGEETNDNEDNNYETTMLLKAKKKKAFNSCLKEKKWRNKWHCEEVHLNQKISKRSSSNSAKKKGS